MCERPSGLDARQEAHGPLAFQVVSFAIVFSLFLVAMVAIAVLAVRWAVHQDRARRQVRGPTAAGKQEPR